MMLSIDPGTRSTGWATWFDDGTLQAAGAGPLAGALILARGFRGTLALEVPHEVRGNARSRDVLLLAFAAGQIDGAHFGKKIHLNPEEWKCQVPKPKSVAQPYIIWERAKRELAETERERIDWPRDKRDRWDVADAIGIGLVALGRMRAGLR